MLLHRQRVPRRLRELLDGEGLGEEGEGEEPKTPIRTAGVTPAAGGSNALEWESDRSKKGKSAREWLRTKANSIEGGTSEVQLGIVAKRILDLPGA